MHNGVFSQMMFSDDHAEQPVVAMPYHECHCVFHQHIIAEVVGPHHLESTVYRSNQCLSTSTAALYKCKSEVCSLGRLLIFLRMSVSLQAR